MPKNAASNSAARCRKPPRRVTEVPRRSGSGSYSPATSQPRSAGKSDVASMPSASNHHRSSGDSTPPGYLQAMDTTAIGSPGSVPVSPSDAPVAPARCSPRSASCTSRATATGVGWSNTSVAGRSRPAAVPSRSRSSTPPSEASPSAVNGRSGSSCCAGTSAVRAVCSSTRSRTASGTADSRARSSAEAVCRSAASRCASCSASAARTTLPEGVRGTDSVS